MLKSDRWIRKMAIEHDMINPFSEKQVREGVVSYGLSSYGYDLRVADEFKIFTNVNCTVVDPKHFDERSFVTMRSDVCIVPPNSFALARSVEYFKIPRDVLTICVGKSTYARCGIIVNVTPFEPEWEGFVTLEISNTTPPPASARIVPAKRVSLPVFLSVRSSVMGWSTAASTSADGLSSFPSRFFSMMPSGRPVTMALAGSIPSATPSKRSRLTPAGKCTVRVSLIRAKPRRALRLIDPEMR